MTVSSTDGEGLGLEDTAHLLANLAAFVPPRYPRFTAQQWRAHLGLLAALLRTVPEGALEAKSATTDTKCNDREDDDSEDEDQVRVEVVSSFTKPSTSTTSSTKLTLDYRYSTYSDTHGSTRRQAARARPCSRSTSRDSEEARSRPN